MLMTLWAHHQLKKATPSLWPGVGLSWAPGVGASATTLSLTFCFSYFRQKRPSPRERGGASHLPTQGLEREGAEAPAPTFLHQLLVGEGPAHDQQHRQEHEGQDDARHRARAQACRVRILACGGGRVSAQPRPVGVELTPSEGGCGPAPPRDAAARGEGTHPQGRPSTSLEFRATHPSAPLSIYRSTAQLPLAALVISS